MLNCLNNIISVIRFLIRRIGFAVIAKKRLTYVVWIFVCLPSFCEGTSFSFAHASEEALHCYELSDVMGFENLISDIDNFHFRVLRNDGLDSLERVDKFVQGIFGFSSFVDYQTPNKSDNGTRNAAQNCTDNIYNGWVVRKGVMKNCISKLSNLNSCLESIFLPALPNGSPLVDRFPSICLPVSRSSLFLSRPSNKPGSLFYPLRLITRFPNLRRRHLKNLCRLLHNSINIIPLCLKPIVAIKPLILLYQDFFDKVAFY